MSGRCIWEYMIAVYQSALSSILPLYVTYHTHVYLCVRAYFLWLCGIVHTAACSPIWSEHKKDLHFISISLVLAQPLGVTYKGLIQLFFSSQQEENIFMVNGLLKQITISNNSISFNLIDFIPRGGERNLNLKPLHF